MTRQEFHAIWKAAAGVTDKSLPQVTVGLDDVEDVVRQVLAAATADVRQLLSRAVVAGRPMFEAWFNGFYREDVYPAESAGSRPILTGMIRRLLSGTLAPGDHPSLSYAKHLIDAGNTPQCNSGNYAWEMAGERFERRNPKL